MALYAGFHKQILPLIAECGDLLVNRQAPTLHKRKTGHIPLYTSVLNMKEKQLIHLLGREPTILTG